MLGHAESIRYDHARTGARGIDSFNITARHYSPGFIELADTYTPGRFKGDIVLGLTEVLPLRLTFRATGRYQLGREARDAHDASLSLSRSFREITLEGTAGVRDTGEAAIDKRVFLSMLWIPHGRGTLRAQVRATEPGGGTSEIRYATSPGPPPGGLVESVGIRTSASASALDGSLSYVHDRFTSTLAASTALDDVTATSVATAEVATAIAFADGHVAWSRPITGSFAIIDRAPTLADQLVGINRTRGTYAAAANHLGAGVIPNLEPYRLSTLRLEAPALQTGTSLGPDALDLVPTYESGTLFVVGSGGTVLLRGTIVDDAGQPIALATATLAVETVAGCDPSSQQLQARVDCIDESHQHTTYGPLMTNRAGRFAVIGIQPGRYVLILSDGRRAEVLIRHGAKGAYQVGAVRAHAGNGASTQPPTTYSIGR
jgi:outer membrane usher protein